MIDLHADAKAIHNAKLRAAFNLTILDVMKSGKINESAVREALPGNAKKFFSAWSPTDTAMNARHCLDLAFVELAEREGITDPDLANFFRFGFTGNLGAMDHAIDYAEDPEAGSAAFEAGKRVADAYRNASF